MKTYKTIKTDYKLESYLLLNIEKQHISKFTKIRISNSNLMIEEGRYKKLDHSQRICPLCNLDIEDEKHFLLKCIKLNDRRINMFTKLQDIIPDFQGLNDEDKFKLMMTSRETDLNTIIIRGISQMYDKRMDMLNKPD